MAASQCLTNRDPLTSDQDDLGLRLHSRLVIEDRASRVKASSRSGSGSGAGSGQQAFGVDPDSPSRSLGRVY